MSTERQKFGTEIDIHVGTTKTYEYTIINADTNLFQPLTDTSKYATAVVKIFKPDGTQVGGTRTVSFTDRANGKVEFTLTPTETAAANAGNWRGELEISNTAPVIIDQQFFNVNILESN